MTEEARVKFLRICMHRDGIGSYSSESLGHNLIGNFETHVHTHTSMYMKGMENHYMLQDKTESHNSCIECALTMTKCIHTYRTLGRHNLFSLKHTSILAC